MTLKPNLRFESGTRRETIAAQRALIHKDFQLDVIQIEMDPVKVTTGKGVLQRLEGDHGAGKTPIVFMSGSRRSCFLEWHPAMFVRSLANPSTISKTAKTDVKLVCSKPCRANFR